MYEEVRKSVDPEYSEYQTGYMLWNAPFIRALAEILEIPKYSTGFTLTVDVDDMVRLDVRKEVYFTRHQNTRDVTHLKSLMREVVQTSTLKEWANRPV